MRFFSEQSKVFDYVCATLNGIATIRTFGAQEVLKNEFHNHLDSYTSAWINFIASNRAFSLFVDLLACMYITVTVVIFVITENYSIGSVGFILSNNILFLHMIQWSLRQNAEVENHMVSVQRIIKFVKVEKEPDDGSDPKKNWPEEGKIVFHNLYLSYNEPNNYVLKNVNFTVLPKEKVGIVGRTGAGKSSLISALLRLTCTKGEIYIDDVPISTLKLFDLRSKISIISQEPVLFSGSVRKNLDFFDRHTDDSLWKVSCLWKVSSSFG